MKDIMDFLGCTDGTPKCDPDLNIPNNKDCICLNKLPLAYSYTPVQEIGSLYDYSKALERGTVFPELDLPKSVYGKNFCKKEDM